MYFCVLRFGKWTPADGVLPFARVCLFLLWRLTRLCWWDVSCGDAHGNVVQLSPLFDSSKSPHTVRYVAPKEKAFMFFEVREMNARWWCSPSFLVNDFCCCCCCWRLSWMWCSWGVSFGDAHDRAVQVNHLASCKSPHQVIYIARKKYLRNTINTIMYFMLTPFQPSSM